MKVYWTRVFGAILSVLLVSLAAAAQQRESGKPAPLALVGTWKLNLAKSKFNSGPPPKLINVHYWWWEGDRLHHRVERLNEKGGVAEVAGHWSARYDAKDHLSGGEKDRTISMKRINEYTTEMTEAPLGGPTSFFSQVVSKDGKTLTITRRIEGKNIQDVMVHDRQ